MGGLNLLSGVSKNDHPSTTFFKIFPFFRQGGDSTAGMQVLPVGKIIEAKLPRKDNLIIVQTCIMFE